MPKLKLTCDLARFTQGCQACGPLVSELWCFFAISTSVIAYLDTYSHFRWLQCCIVVYIDRTDVALGATELRLGIQLPSWGVPTPPVQAIAAQAATVWDLSDLSADSETDDDI